MSKVEKIAINALKTIAKAPRINHPDGFIAIAQTALDAIEIVKKRSSK